MKKQSSWIVALVMALLVVSGATAFAQAPIVVKVASPSTPSDSNVMGFEYFANLVNHRSEGRLDVQVFHSGQLGSARDYTEGLQLGSIEMAEVTTSVFSAFADEFMIFDLPYIMKDVDHLRRVVESPIGEQLSQLLEERAGIKILAWLIRSPRSIYTSRNPIRTPEDMENMKIRVMESPLMVGAMEAVGARPVPLPATERYMALQTGVVDAAENSPPLIITEKEYEVTNYLSLTEHFITPNTLVVSAAFFNSLPSDLQDIIVQAAEDAAHYQRGAEQAQLDLVFETLRAQGMEINTITDKQPFIDRVAHIYEEYADEIGQDLIDAVLAID